MISSFLLLNGKAAYGHEVVHFIIKMHEVYFLLLLFVSGLVFFYYSFEPCCGILTWVFGVVQFNYFRRFKNRISFKSYIV